MRKLPRRNINRYEPYRISLWIVQTARRWSGQNRVTRAYLHPCGDVILVPHDVESPLSDRLLLGTYTGAAVEADVLGDVETALVELEEAA